MKIQPILHLCSLSLFLLNACNTPQITANPVNNNANNNNVQVNVDTAAESEQLKALIQKLEALEKSGGNTADVQDLKQQAQELQQNITEKTVAALEAQEQNADPQTQEALQEHIKKIQEATPSASPLEPIVQPSQAPTPIASTSPSSSVPPNSSPTTSTTPSTEPPSASASVIPTPTPPPTYVTGCNGESIEVPHGTPTPTLSCPPSATPTPIPTPTPYLAQEKLLYNCRTWTHSETFDLYSMNLSTGATQKLSSWGAGTVSSIDTYNSKIAIVTGSSAPSSSRIILANLSEGQLANKQFISIYQNKHPSGQPLEPPQQVSVQIARFSDENKLFLMFTPYGASNREVWSYNLQTEQLLFLSHISTFHDGEELIAQNGQALHAYRDSSTGTALAKIMVSGGLNTIKTGQNGIFYRGLQFINSSEALMSSNNGILKVNVNTGQTSEWLNKQTATLSYLTVDSQKQTAISGIQEFLQSQVNFHKIDLTSKEVTPFGSTTCLDFRPLASAIF